MVLSRNPDFFVITVVVVWLLCVDRYRIAFCSVIFLTPLIRIK